MDYLARHLVGMTPKVMDPDNTFVEFETSYFGKDVTKLSMLQPNQESRLDFLEPLPTVWGANMCLLTSVDRFSQFPSI